MRFLSVCSGIEAASVAWEPLGWSSAGFAEIDAFPSAVLAHRYPSVPNFGDFTKIQAHDLDGPIDLLVGGTPCQSFSVAGRRAGLDDPRGHLALEYLALARRLRPRWLVWENVPGVLSSSGGRDFGAFLGALGDCGYGWAYRVLDAQHFGVPQRRRRVFVVGYLGDWRRAAAVLLERASLRGDPAPSREAGERLAGTLTGGSDTGRNHGKRSGSDRDTLVAALTANGVGTCGADDNQGQAGHLRPGSNSLGAICFDEQQVTSRDNRSRCAPGDPAPALSRTPERVSVAFADCFNGDITGDIAATMGTRGSSQNSSGPTLIQRSAVRRLTPRECERLQGFPDDWTLVPYRGKPASDGPRYRAIGNSMAVPVVRWIGERIETVENLNAA